jgi:putative ABC transport system ATP-binding protein
MIQLSHISKTFRSGRGHVHAIADLSLSIPTGSFAAVIGKSGSGKSTLLNCMCGLEAPDQGNVLCFGTPLHRLNAAQLSRFQRSQLGFVFQRGNLISYLTVDENIGLPLTLNGIRGKERAHRIASLLEAIDLTAAAKALPHELSGGETQRVSVARAVAHQPRLLLADEPTANLDTATGLGIVKMMRRLGTDYGCTIIMATHDSEIINVADVIIRIKDGQIDKEDA